MTDIDNKIRAAIAAHIEQHHQEVRVGAAAVEHVAVMEGKPVAGEWDASKWGGRRAFLYAEFLTVAGADDSGAWFVRRRDASGVAREPDLMHRETHDLQSAMAAADAWARANHHLLDWQMPPASEPADSREAFKLKWSGPTEAQNAGRCHLCRAPFRKGANIIGGVLTEFYRTGSASRWVGRCVECPASEPTPRETPTAPAGTARDLNEEVCSWCNGSGHPPEVNGILKDCDECDGTGAAPPPPPAEPRAREALRDAAEMVARLWADFTSQEMYGEFLREGMTPDDFSHMETEMQAARDALSAPATAETAAEDLAAIRDHLAPLLAAKCTGCPHAPHLGTCNGRLGATAHRCACSRQAPTVTPAPAPQPRGTVTGIVSSYRRDAIPDVLTIDCDSPLPADPSGRVEVRWVDAAPAPQPVSGESVDYVSMLRVDAMPAKFVIDGIRAHVERLAREVAEWQRTALNWKTSAEARDRDAARAYNEARDIEKEAATLRARVAELEARAADLDAKALRAVESFPTSAGKE